MVIGSAAVIAIVACGGGGRRRLTNGKLDVYASVPSSARVEPITTTDSTDERHSWLVRVHLDQQLYVDIAHRSRSCDVGSYDHLEPSSDGQVHLTVLGTDRRPDGYVVRLETDMLDCPEGSRPPCWNSPPPMHLAIEACSTSTQTLCKGIVPLGDEGHARVVASLCDSIRTVD
jgi:hypothetical protein